MFWNSKFSGEFSLLTCTSNGTNLSHPAGGVPDSEIETFLLGIKPNAGLSFPDIF